jgi:PAS domain S-box-containing protein
MDVIVVASSEPGIQESIRVLLGEGHIVVPARTISELMSAVVEQPVDLVILDEFIENVDCATAYKRLLSIAPETTCILLAVQTTSETAGEMRTRGVYDIVAKPFGREELTASSARALERSHLLARLAAANAQRASASDFSSPPAAGAGDSQAARRREMLDSLRKFLKALTGVIDPGRLHETVLETITDMFSINRVTLLLWDEKTQQMSAAASVGLSSDLMKGYSASTWTAIATWLRRNDQVLHLGAPEIRTDSEQALAIRKEMALLQSLICIPMVSDGRLVGALAIGKKVTGRHLSDDDVEFLCLLSQQVAAIIVNATRHRDVFVQKERFEEILQGVNSGLIATDSQGRLTVFNKTAEQILGLKASEVLGKSVQRVGSAFADIMFRSLREKKSLCRHELADPGTKALLGISTSLLTDSSGRQIGAVALFTDLSTVSPRTAATGDEAWQRCALCMAHEIKNPLVAIRTFAQLFPESYDDEKFRNEFSGIVIKEIDKLDGVVERLMRFARQFELSPGPGNLHSLLDEELAEVSEEAQSRGVEFKKDFKLDNGSLSFDRELLKEAVEQILNNAVEAMPSGGTLSISTSEAVYPDQTSNKSENGVPPGKVAEILISDTGVGIPPEELPDLFKPFHTSKLKGMGLGLPISRRIVREHCGDITVTSKPNEGTTVRIILPYGAK